MSIRFDGRVAIVTGAAAGLGSFARAGARGTRCEGGGQRFRRQRGRHRRLVRARRKGGRRNPSGRGGEAISHGADVTNPEQVAHMVAAALETWGRVDILINNAGILRDASFAKGSLRDFQTVVNVHLMGAVVCSHAVWPHMRAANFGRILMTSSTSGHLRQFRPVELRRRQDRSGRPDERAADRRRQERHPRECAGALGSDAHDAGSAAGGGARLDDTGARHAGGVVPGQRRRAATHDPAARGRAASRASTSRKPQASSSGRQGTARRKPSRQRSTQISDFSTASCLRRTRWSRTQVPAPGRGRGRCPVSL